MTREEVLEKYQNGYADYESEEFYKILSDIFLESSSPKELVDKAFRDSHRNNLGHLKEEVYDLPVEGYENLYDYICSLDYIKKVAVPDSYKQRKEYKDITLKRLGISGLSIPINTELLYSINPATGKIIIDEFLDQLKEVIEEEELGLTNREFVYIDSIRLAKDLYQRRLIRALRYCDDALYDQIIDEKNNKTILDILAENNYIYGLPILGVEWNNYNSYKYEYHLLDKFIPSLNKTVLEYLLDNNYLNHFNYYKYEKNIDYWKKILRNIIKINRLDLLSAIPCEFLKWPINEDDPNSIDYYTLLKNNSIKYEGYDEFNDTRVAYDYLMEPSADLEYFIKKCSFNIFKSKYKEGSNETIATLFFSIIYKKDDKTRCDYIRILGDKGWIDEEIICAAYYKGITIYINNRDFYNIYIGINANHVLDYDIHYGDMKEKYEFDVDYLSAEFLKAYENDSDENTLNAILTSYFAYKETNPIEAQKELKVLIILKKINPRFVFKNSTSEMLVDFHKQQVQILNCFDLCSLNHELAHILFFIIRNFEMEYLEKSLPDIKNEKTKEACYNVALAITDSIYLYPRNFNYSRGFKKYIESRFGSVENYKDIMREEYKAMIGDPQLLADYLAYDKINQKTADMHMLANAIYEDKKRYTEEWAIEEYVTYRYETERTTFVREKIKKDYRALLIYENFMDAYFGGLLNTIYKTKLERRKRLMETSTHGEEYFFSNIKRINEMFANFVALKKLAVINGKQTDSFYYLDLIKKNCGEEVYNGLELLYKKALDGIQLDEEITLSKKV